MSVKNEVVFEKFIDGNVFTDFIYDVLDFDMKVKYLKKEYGDNFKVFNSSIECISYIKELLHSNNWSPEIVRSIEGISPSDLVSDKKFYVQINSINDIDFNSEDNGIFDDPLMELDKYVFEDYVKPYLNDKFYITINGVNYEQEITEELVDEYGVEIDKFQFKLVGLIDGKFILRIYGRNMTKRGKEIEGVCNTPYTLNSGKTCITVELKH